MSVSGREAEFMELLSRSLESRGYSVYLHPSRELLPAFMGDYSPDLVALGRPKNLAIEIRLEGQKSNLRDLKKPFEESNDWEWLVYYISPKDLDVQRTPFFVFEKAIREIELLIGEGHTQAALLMSWAALEAIGRSLLPEELKRAQTPARLIEVLAAEGHVSGAEASILRSMVVPRNQLIHGSLETAVDLKNLTDFVSVLKNLRKIRAEI